ncbi:MAG TPA: hypothetical protein VD993_15245 [Chitinophagaceae bacterium]|nr:hypothetical protein [Chitinophagaceae bacterium]
MKEKHPIEQLVNDTLDSLDGLSRAKANPFLFTRVEARLRQGGKNAWERVIGYISRPTVALAMLCMIILANGVVMYLQSASNDTTTEQSQLALTEEYSLTVSSFYDDENPEP